MSAASGHAGAAARHGGSGRPLGPDGRPDGPGPGGLRAGTMPDSGVRKRDATRSVRLLRFVESKFLGNSLWA